MFYLIHHFSYSLCVPIFLTSTIPCLYSTCTHNRYLLPHMLKMACWLPGVSALGNLLLSSWGFAHVALATSASHDSLCDRTSACFPLKSCSGCLPNNLIVKVIHANNLFPA